MYYIIYQTAFIGDIILSSSMINTIKQADPKSNIIFVTTPIGKSVLHNDMSIDKIIVYDKKKLDKGLSGLLTKAKEIRKITHGERSIFISPHRFLRAALMALLSGSGIRAGFKGSVFSFLYNRRVRYQFGIHEVTRNFRLLRAVFDHSFNLEPERPKLFFSQYDLEKVKKKIFNIFHPDDKIVSIAPGSVWPTKRWPAEYFTNVIHALDKAGIKVLLIGGDGDRKLCESLERGNTLNLAGELSLPESAAAIGMSRALVSNDSAPLHIASAVNTPTVAIFGATTSHLGFGPLADGSVVLENNELECRPCGRHGSERCAKKHFACMNSITSGSVIDALMKIIK